MKLKGVTAEDFTNYKLPSLFIASAYCDWKCCKENGLEEGTCQNRPLASTETLDVPTQTIYNLYATNDITQAIVIGGLEPMLQFDEVLSLIKLFRDNQVACPFVIYTGYNESEIQNEITKLKQYNNIIIKFGRYIPTRPSRYDPILGVTLASDNQYAVQLSKSNDQKIQKNPDAKYAQSVIDALKANDYYCPCKLEHTPDTKCMCLEFRRQESGMCECGLYIKG